MPFAYFRVPIPWLELARRTVRETLDDGCLGLAAQLAFYFLLAVFPALLFFVALLSYLPIGATLASTIARLDSVLPREVIGLIQRELDKMASGTSGGLLTFGIAGAIWSSSSAMSAIITALNRAYDIEEARTWWKVRLLAIALTIALALFVVVAFGLVVGGSGLALWIAEHAGLGDAFQTTWTVAQWPVALLLVVFAVNLVYHFAPNLDSEWAWVSPGSALATVLGLLVSFGFKLYVRSFGSYSAVYGAIAGVIVLMLWLYLSGFALLVGAELNSEIDHARPARDVGPQAPGRRKAIGTAH